MNESVSTFSSKDIIFGTVILVLGVLILSISKLMSGSTGLWELGWILVGIGIPTILQKAFLSIAKPKLFRIMGIMKDENLLEINRDGKRGRELITKMMSDWAQSKEDRTLKICGIAMISLFGNRGILNELFRENRIINPSAKRIKVLLLNPYSIIAITKSIQQNRPFNIDTDPMSAITEHTIVRHKKSVLYDEFRRTVQNIFDIQRNNSNQKIDIICHVYSSTPPNFLILNSQEAFFESLVHVKKKNETRPKGLLPHLIYGTGEIRDGFESHFDYIWKYDSVAIEDFHENIEEKYYEINRLFLLYGLQKEFWERQWDNKHPGGSLNSSFDKLYQRYKEIYPEFAPETILDLGCGDGRGGSIAILKDHINSSVDLVDISQNAIDILGANIANLGIPKQNISLVASDMLTFLNECKLLQYSLIHANFSVIYMTKIKAVEIYNKIFNVLDYCGIFMVSVWTTAYFDLPVSKYGEEGKRGPHEFSQVPMTENLQILSRSSELRQGEIRRFYRGFEELLEEFQSADVNNIMDLTNINYQLYENDAILTVWVQKKK